MLLGCTAVLQGYIHFAVLEEVFPRILVLALQRGDHDLLFVREAQELLFARVEQHTPERSQLFKAVVEDNLTAVLGDHSDVRRIHEDDVKHGDGKAGWNLVLCGCHAPLFLNVLDLLKLSPFICSPITVQHKFRLVIRVRINLPLIFFIRPGASND